MSRVERISGHFTRVTFACEQFDCFGTDGLDQRIKIVFPVENQGLADLGGREGAADWHARWRALPEGERPPFRTYTVRAARSLEREIDVDFVTHGDGGPAARWLNGASSGDEVIIVGPDARSIHSATGIDWHPGSASRVLLAGDETAVPAICAILESLPAGIEATAFIEVPELGDQLPIESDATITWLARDRGDSLEQSLRNWVTLNQDVFASDLARAAQPLADIDVDTELLWDSPADASGEFYAWIAGESAVVKVLRRFLVTETGIDRSRVAFMGYWRLGKSEAQQ